MPSNTHVCLSYMLSWILTSGMIYDGHSQMTKRQQYCKSHRSHSDRQHDKSGSGLHSYLGWVCITRACWNDCDATACYGRAKVRKRVLVLHAVLGLHFQHDLRWQLTHDKKDNNVTNHIGHTQTDNMTNLGSGLHPYLGGG